MPIYAVVSGRAGMAPEIRQGETWAMGTFSLATTRYSTLKKEEVTDWIRVRFIGHHWVNRLRCVARGTMMSVTGILHVEEFEDRDGVKRWVLHMTGLDFQLLWKKGADGYRDGARVEESGGVVSSLPSPPPPPPIAGHGNTPAAQSLGNEDLPF